MITLDKLAKLANEEDERKRKAEIKRQEQLEYETNNIFHNIIDGLEQRLIDAATDGEHKLSVGCFSAFTSIRLANVTEELLRRRFNRGNCANYGIAWNNNTIGVSDVIECMCGSLKKVYDFCLENGLNPQIDYWTDGGGQDEGFEIIIKW